MKEAKDVAGSVEEKMKKLCLDNKMIGQHLLVVDNTKTMVPVKIDNLEDTRNAHCLAVHGLAPDVTTGLPNAQQSPTVSDETL